MLKKMWTAIITVFLMSNVYSAKNFEGRYFGKVKYNGKSRQVGLLLNKIKDKDSYYGVVMEYLSPLREKKFISKFLRGGKKGVFSRKKIGYLNELLQWVQIYKFEKVEGKSKYRALKLKVVDGQIVTLKDEEAGVLVLRKGKVKGSRFYTTIRGKKRTLKFRRFMSGYRFPLKSTWESYSPGPYNPGYKQDEIRILKLTRGEKKPSSI